VVKPGKVQSLAIAAMDLTNLKLAWTPPLENGALPVTDYKITYRFDAFKGTSVWKHDPLLEPSVSIPDLPLGTGFTFSVRAITPNAVGNAVSIHLVTPEPALQTGLAANVQAQYDFLLKTWNSRSAGHFGYIPYRDCANWTSQSLLVEHWSARAHGDCEPHRTHRLRFEDLLRQPHCSRHVVERQPKHHRAASGRHCKLPAPELLGVD